MRNSHSLNNLGGKPKFAIELNVRFKKKKVNDDSKISWSETLKNVVTIFHKNWKDYRKVVWDKNQTSS